MQSFWLTMDKWLNCITLNLMNYMKTFFIHSEEVLYEINDKLIQLPRIFIVSAGLPNFTQYRCVIALFFSLSLSPLNCSFSLKKNQLKLLLTSCINQIINWSEIPVRGPLSLEPLLFRWELTFECTVCTWNETYMWQL